MAKDDMLCHCGTQGQAVEAAKKLYVQLASSDCPSWALGVAAALRTLAIEAIVSEKLTKNDTMLICNAMGSLAKEMVPIEELKTETKIKHAQLYALYR